MLLARKSVPAVSGPSRAAPQTRPQARPRPSISKYAPAAIEQVFPPLPSSSDVESGTKSSSASAARARSAITIPDTSSHRAGIKPETSSDVDSRSSSDVVETEIIIDGPPEASVVLGSEGSSGSDGAPRSVVLDGERLNPQVVRGRTTANTPRNRAHSKSSPSQASGSHSDHTEARTEPELEVSIANVSLHDHPPNPLEAGDMDYAHTVAAVEGIALNDEPEPGPSEPTSSRSISVSCRESSRNGCSVEGCSAKFSSTAQLHTHMSRDHGIRLSLGAGQPNKGKRKATMALPTSTRKRIAIVGSQGQAASLPVAPRGSSTSSPSGSDSSQRFVERNNTVGFDPFAQNIPDRDASVSVSDTIDFYILTQM